MSRAGADFDVVRRINVLGDGFRGIDAVRARERLVGNVSSIG